MNSQIKKKQKKVYFLNTMCKHLRVFTVGVYRDTHFSIDKYYNIIFIIWIYFLHCFCVWKKQTNNINFAKICGFIHAYYLRMISEL